MAPKPPPFASKEYWEDRFQKNEQAFDWLLPASCMDPHIAEALSCRPQGSSNILHIGCGTSLLSFHLRAHVDDPAQIHNVDFSAKAIEWGVQNERDRFCKQQGDGIRDVRDGAYEGGSIDGSHNMMRWSQVSLLSQVSILSTCSQSNYSIIVDKSTADAIACGDDVEVSFKYSRDCENTGFQPHNETSAFVHPVCILALHLALLAAPSCRWIVISYSSTRFHFLDNNDSIAESLPLELLDRGYPDPARYWRLVSKEAVDAPEEKNAGPVHRPRISHWLYVLERTDVDLRPW